MVKNLAQQTELRRKEEWGPLSEEAGWGEWFDKYFGIKENPKKLKARITFGKLTDAILDIEALDGSHGYFIARILQDDRDFERSAKYAQNLSEKQGREVLRYFVDYQRKIAGFSWRIC